MDKNSAFKGTNSYYLIEIQRIILVLLIYIKKIIETNTISLKL